MWIRCVDIVIRLCHHVGNLRPSHTILEGDLIWCCAHGWCFHLTTAKITEHGTTDHGVFVLALPLSTVWIGKKEKSETFGSGQGKVKFVFLLTSTL